MGKMINLWMHTMLKVFTQSSECLGLCSYAMSFGLQVQSNTIIFSVHISHWAVVGQLLTTHQHIMDGREQDSKYTYKEVWEQALLNTVEDEWGSGAGVGHWTGVGLWAGAWVRVGLRAGAWAGGGLRAGALDWSRTEAQNRWMGRTPLEEAGPVSG